MATLKMIYKSIASPLEVINQKAEKGKLAASLLIVLTAALLGSIVAPVVYYLSFKDKYELTLRASKIVIPFCAGILTWLAACILFWVFSLVFKKGIGLGQIASTWGFSYIPNIICIIAYTCLQLYSGSYTGNGFAAFVMNTFFIAVLMWKVIYYFIEVRNVLNVSAFELIIMTILMGISFVALMTLGSIVGIQVPML